MNRSSTDDIQVAGVRLTHPERLLYPAMGVTKRRLAEYFAAQADVMLPHVAERPVSLVRCPQGRRKTCFFQKHAGSGVPEAIGRLFISEKSGAEKEYLLCNSEQSLVACAQIGALELHLWPARADRLEQPERLVFDLDPGEGVGFAAVKQAAGELRELLAQGDLESWPLLTGGKGLHVVVALQRRHGWDTIGDFARHVAETLAARDPDRFVATMAKAKRRGRIFIDYLRNRRGATAIAPFSPRARAGAPIAAPVTWNELQSIERSDAFSLTDPAKRLAARARAWPDAAARRARLTRDGAARMGFALEPG